MDVFKFIFFQPFFLELNDILGSTLQFVFLGEDLSSMKLFDVITGAGPVSMEWQRWAMDDWLTTRCREPMELLGFMCGGHAHQ